MNRESISRGLRTAGLYASLVLGNFGSFRSFQLGFEDQKAAEEFLNGYTQARKRWNL